MSQIIKNLPAMQETHVQSLGWEDLQEKGMTSHSNILATDRGAWWATVLGVAKTYFTKDNTLLVHPCCCKLVILFFILWLSSILGVCVWVCVYLYPLVCWQALQLLPFPGYCKKKKCCYEHWSSCIFLLVFLFSSDIYPGVELLDLMVVLFLVFWGTSILFSIVAESIYIPTNSVLLLLSHFSCVRLCATP